MVPADAPALAALMLDAYRGTIDDGGGGPDEAAAEVSRLLAGDYGPFDQGASELVERDGGIVSATLVTSHGGMPLIAFSMTASRWKRRGLARDGLVRTLHRLRAAGAVAIHLAVTPGNTAAERLYASLGFAVSER